LYKEDRHKIIIQEEHPKHHSSCHIVFFNINTYKSQLKYTISQKNKILKS